MESFKTEKELVFCFMVNQYWSVKVRDLLPTYLMLVARILCRCAGIDQVMFETMANLT